MALLLAKFVLKFKKKIHALSNLIKVRQIWTDLENPHKNVKYCLPLYKYIKSSQNDELWKRQKMAKMATKIN